MDLENKIALILAGNFNPNPTPSISPVPSLNLNLNPINATVIPEVQSNESNYIQSNITVASEKKEIIENVVIYQSKDLGDLGLTSKQDKSQDEFSKFLTGSINVEPLKVSPVESQLNLIQSHQLLVDEEELSPYGNKTKATIEELEEPLPTPKRAISPQTFQKKKSKENLLAVEEKISSSNVISTTKDYPSPNHLRVEKNNDPIYRTPSRSSRNSSNTPESQSIDQTIVRPIRVAVRVRPFNDLEVTKKSKRTISSIGPDLVIVNPTGFDADPDQIAVIAIPINDKKLAHTFKFDTLLWQYDSETKYAEYFDQIKVYEEVGLDLIENLLNGINSSCFACGSSGTGKTYSLFGPTPKVNKKSSNKINFEDFQLNPESGLVPRIFRDIVYAIKSKRVLIPWNRIFISFLEVYNEKIYDLLNDQSSSAQDPSAPSLKIREHPNLGPYVENSTRVEIQSIEDVFQILFKGLKNRSTFQTSINPESSRSHAVVTLELSQVDVPAMMSRIENPPTKRVPVGSASRRTEPIDEDTLSKSIKLQIIDLAGFFNSKEDELSNNSAFTSITPAKSDPRSDKERKEVKLIRQSLSTLGIIIQSLSKGESMKSLPYRDSILTFLLRDALTGNNYTTVLSTISPSSLCYEETLSTLRFAEKLSSLHKKTIPNSSSLTTIQLSLRDSKTQLINEFRKFHQDIGFNQKGSLAAKQLLHHTVSDPQQRIAKLTRVATESNKNSNGIGTTNTPYQSRNGSKDIPEMIFINPLDNHPKSANDINSRDMTQIYKAYRDLKAEMNELIMERDQIRTDRDTYRIEITNLREKLEEAEEKVNELSRRTENLNKSIKSYEKELSDQRSQNRKKEENIEYLVQQLNEQKNARSNAEDAYQTRTKDLLNRFDTLKKQNQSLQARLDISENRDGIYSSEKLDLLNQINKLKKELESIYKTLEKMNDENMNLKKDQDKLIVKMQDYDEIKEQKHLITQEKVSLLEKYEKMLIEFNVLKNERDQLCTIIGQKDNLLAIQNEQFETSIKMLQQKQTIQSTTHESMLAEAKKQTATQSSEWLALQDSLKALFSSENEVLYNEMMDANKMIILIKDMRQKIEQFDQIFNENKTLQSCKSDLENKLVECARVIEQQDESVSDMDEYITLLEQDINDARQRGFMSNIRYQNNAYYMKKYTKTTINISQMKRSSNNFGIKNYGQQFGDLLNNYDSYNDPSLAPLLHHIETLKTENAFLKGQLDASQRETNLTKEELKLSQGTMQREFASLWMSVQELNKLDAIKDKSIQDLIQEKNKLSYEKESLAQECDSLKRELQEVDSNLLQAVGHTHQSIDFHKSVNFDDFQKVISRSGSRDSLAAYGKTPQVSSSQSFKGFMTPLQAQNQSRPTSGQATPRESFQTNPFSHIPPSQRSLNKKPNNQPIPHASNGEYKDALSEKILERQIEELTDFLQDEEKLKKAAIQSASKYSVKHGGKPDSSILNSRFIPSSK